MRKVELIRRELGKVNPVDFSNPDQAKIICPFHDDSNPSLDVRLTPRTYKKDGKVVTIGVGTFNCWSCKAHGPWNKLATKLGLETWDQEKQSDYENQPENPFYEREREIESMLAVNKPYEAPKTDGPWQGPWRGLPGPFLRSIGAESSWDEEFGEYRLLLPICDAFGTRVGHVKARGENSRIPDKQKYLNSKGFNGTSYWYGLHLEKEPKVLVVVEGPYDMLRFRYHGIPAIANLGVQLKEDDESSISDEKIAQILSSGCTKVVLALDADRAGRAATPGFTKSFRNWGFQVYDLNLSRYLKSPDEKMDPGNCPEEVMTDLKAFLSTIS